MITIYSSPTCAKCKMLKDWCEKNHIQYTALDVTENTDAQAEIASRGLMTLPVVSFEDNYLAGEFKSLTEYIKSLPING